MGKINAYDEIMTENQRKRKYGNQIFLHKSSSIDGLGIQFTAC